MHVFLKLQGKAKGERVRVVGVRRAGPPLLALKGEEAARS